MAVLNPESQSEASQKAVDQAQAQAQAQAQDSMSQASQVVNQSGSLVGDINNLLQQVNQLMENPVVQQRIQSKLSQANNKSQAQRPGLQRNEPQHSAGSSRDPSPQARASEEDPGNDFSTMEIFQKKLRSEEGRKELSEGIQQIGMIVEDELNGMETTLQELADYLESEELENQIQELKNQGLL